MARRSDSDLHVPVVDGENPALNFPRCQECYESLDGGDDRVFVPYLII